MLDRMKADLDALHRAGQFRELAQPRGLQLSSNDYLGLSKDPRLKEAVIRAVEDEERICSTGSRLLSGNSAIWDEIESEFAEFLGVEGAVYFSSGYAANVGLLSSALKPPDVVFSDSANHASLIDGIRLSRARRVIFPHLDLNALEDALRRETGPGEKVIVVEAIFSMDGDRAPIAELLDLCALHDAHLIVDEAHSTGVEGAEGRGSVHPAGRSERILATVHTCGKALASMGAFVAGSRTLRDFLINHARTFIFSTALPPYCAAQVRAALAISRGADAGRNHLCELGRYLRARLKASGAETGRSDSQIVPVVLGSNDVALRLAGELGAAGFAVRAIRPPSVPHGTSRLRLSAHAGLSFSNIDAFVEAFNDRLVYHRH